MPRIAFSNPANKHQFITLFLWSIDAIPCPPLRCSLSASAGPSFICCDERFFPRISCPIKSFLPVLQAPFQGVFSRIDGTKNNKKSYGALYLKVLSPPRPPVPTSNVSRKLYSLSAGDKKRQWFVSSSRCWLLGVFSLCVLVGGKKISIEQNR